MPTKADLVTWDKLAPLLVMLLIGLIGWIAREAHVRQTHLETLVHTHMEQTAATQARSAELVARLDRMQQQINLCLQQR